MRFVFTVTVGVGLTRKTMREGYLFINQSIHEKLHALAGRIGLRKFPPSP